MDNMTHQLHEKKKLIEEVSNSINNGYVYAHIQDNICQEWKMKTKANDAYGP